MREKGEGESRWKSGEDEHVFIAGRGVGLADEAFPQTPYRTRRAVRAVTGLAWRNSQVTILTYKARQVLSNKSGE